MPGLVRTRNRDVGQVVDGGDVGEVFGARGILDGSVERGPHGPHVALVEADVEPGRRDDRLGVDGEVVQPVVQPGEAVAAVRGRRRADADEGVGRVGDAVAVVPPQTNAGLHADGAGLGDVAVGVVVLGDGAADAVRGRRRGGGVGERLRVGAAVAARPFAAAHREQLAAIEDGQSRPGAMAIQVAAEVALADHGVVRGDADQPDRLGVGRERRRRGSETDRERAVGLDRERRA